MNILQNPPNPFPPTDIEAIAITNIGVMFAHMIILFSLIIMLVFYTKKVSNYSYLPVITIYGFSLLIGMNGLEHLHTPFSPLFEIFFMVIQTIMFLTYSLNFSEILKEKKSKGF